jgi:hypothetical protein
MYNVSENWQNKDGAHDESNGEKINNFVPATKTEIILKRIKMRHKRKNFKW